MTDARPAAWPGEWAQHVDVKGQMMTMWPDGYSFGATVSFDFDAEEVWIGEDPENQSRPGVLSQGAYSPKVAIPLILDMLERQGITSTFYVPGRDALRQRPIEQITAGSRQHARAQVALFGKFAALSKAQGFLKIAALMPKALQAEIVGHALLLD